MNFEFNKTLSKAAVIIATSGVFLAERITAAITDDFNDGNDNGWTHYEPLGSFGVSATYSFPSGTLDALEYRIQVSASPDPGTIGPARAGSLRFDEASAFSVSVDLHGWDNNLSQSFGALTRINQPAFGTTDGYAVVYSTAGLFSLLRIDNEVVTILDSMPVLANPANNYRLLVTTIGNGVRGELYERPQLAGPIASVFAFDSTYSSGSSGVFAFANTGSGAVDARFDFYQTAIPEPSTWLLLTLGAFVLSGRILLRRRDGNTTCTEDISHA